MRTYLLALLPILASVRSELTGAYVKFDNGGSDIWYLSPSEAVDGAPVTL